MPRIPDSPPSTATPATAPAAEPPAAGPPAAAVDDAAGTAAPAADAHGHAHATDGDSFTNVDVDTDAGFLAALRADNLHLIEEHDPDPKLKKIENSPFVFFRGTAGLFYRRMQGLDADKPRALIAGDIHPENFGVMEAADGTLSFGIDDFDEAALAPFSWDLRRGATGFSLYARDRDFAAADKRKIATAFVEGYRDAIKTFAVSGAEHGPFLHGAEPPAILKDLFKKSKKRRQSKILNKYTKDGAFVQKTKLTPAPQLVDAMQAVIDDYRDTLGKDAPSGDAYFKVKDVGIRTGSGTASLGLARYYVLIDGKAAGHDDDIVLELKEELPSTLLALGGSPLHARYSVSAQANRAAHIMRAGEDPLHGYVKYDGKEFLVRERSPKVVDPDLEDWDVDDVAAYARACGGSVAASHARYGRTDERVADAMTDALTTEIVDFAIQADDQVTADHARYLKLRENGDI
jgi:uncharacterized protein (DUF2252 family)